MIFEHSDYRSFLRTTLADRISKNPAYSLRAMARALEISPALLSKVQRGQMNLSPDNAIKIAKRLGLDEKQSEYFCSLVQFESTKSAEAKNKVLEKLNSLNRKRQVHNVDLDSYRVISEWYHFPILEMTRLKGFKLTASNAARKLGISVFEADAAIERLLRLGLLERTTNGNLKKTQRRFVVQASITNEALRSCHKQILEKAIESIPEQDPKERHLAWDTISIDPRKIPEAKARIDEFAHELVDLLGSCDAPTETYVYSTQLFRLTRKKERS